LEGIKDDLQTVIAEQASDTVDHQRTLKWYNLRYPEEQADIQNPGTIRPSTEILNTANDFFEFTQKEISRRVKGNFAAGLLSKKRNVTAEMLAISSRKPQKEPQKYLAP
jgi:hypothetical protein